MMTRAALVLPLSALLVADSPRPAAACGGCFSPPETVTSVESHRMVIALSLEQTTLWDQIRYTGSPQDFVWVLPVPTPDAHVELADPLFFDQLESLTAPQVTPPPLPPPPDCPDPPPGYGGGALDAGAYAGEADAGVDVYHEEVVGPYETVTIGSTDAGALQGWLDAHGYQVPESTIPTIAYYVEQHSVFIVMRLAPDAGVSAMQPVRVRYPGFMGTFPLRMVKVGASGLLEMTLWVIADQRYAPANYATARVAPEDLVWDFALGRSNYAQLFRAAIDASGGRAFVTEAAAPLSSFWLDSAEEVAVATVGIEYPYLTRLRTSMLLDYIDADVVFAPAAEAGDVSNYLQAEVSLNAPPPPTCPDYGSGARGWPWVDDGDERGLRFCAVHVGGGAGSAGLAAAALLLVLVRRRRTLARRPRA